MQVKAKLEPREGFETAGKIASAREWEELDNYWLDKSFEERMKGLFGLIEIYLKMNNLPDRIDFTIAGKRLSNNVQ